MLKLILTSWLERSVLTKLDTITDFVVLGQQLLASGA